MEICHAHLDPQQFKHKHLYVVAVEKDLIEEARAVIWFTDNEVDCVADAFMQASSMLHTWDDNPLEVSYSTATINQLLSTTKPTFYGANVDVHFVIAH